MDKFWTSSKCGDFKFSNNPCPFQLLALDSILKILENKFVTCIPLCNEIICFHLMSYSKLHCYHEWSSYSDFLSSFLLILYREHLIVIYYHFLMTMKCGDTLAWHVWLCLWYDMKCTANRCSGFNCLDIQYFSTQKCWYCIEGILTSYTNTFAWYIGRAIP